MTPVYFLWYNRKYDDSLRVDIAMTLRKYCTYFIFIISSISFLLLIYSQAHSRSHYTHRILIIGDSISAAYGMDINNGWVQLLQEKLHHTEYAHYEVINASISGNTSGDGLSRLPQLLTLYSPHIVVIELGGNDGLRGYPTKLIANNLQKMIRLSQEAHASIVLAGMHIPPNYGKRYTQSFHHVFQQLAKKNTLSYIPFILEGVPTRPHLMQKDGIHPTAEAQPFLLNNAWEAIHSLLQK